MNELTKKDLIKYLKCVKGLETSLYSQKHALEKMKKETQKCQNESTRRHIPHEIEKKVGTDHSSLEIFFGRFAIAIGIALACVALLGSLGSDINAAMMLCLPIGIGCGILWGFCDVANIRERNLIERTRESDRVKNVNARIDMQNEENEKKAIAATNRKVVVDAEIEFLEKSIANVSEHLQNYYDLDVIYPKYRGLVYICSMYEYLESGRCESLMGPYGAYNLLENDIKFARVVEKMENIVSNLEQIKENQNELYYAIRETNNQLDKLDASLKSISTAISEGNAINQDIKQSIGNIEYNSKISAESEQFTAAYHFFKN